MARSPDKTTHEDVICLNEALSPAPLTEASYYILISLLEPLHGYAVMQKVREMSGGRVRLGPGTLYGALSTMQSAGLIEMVEGSSPDSRRKTYVITPRGREVVKAEIDRLEQMIAHGKMMLASGGV